MSALSGLVPRSGRLEDLPAPLRQAIEEERREYREAVEEAADEEQAVHAMRQGQKPLAAAEIDEFVHL
jgi:hypothetical protein